MKIFSFKDFVSSEFSQNMIIICSIHEREISLQLMEAGIFQFVSDSQIDFGGGEEYYDEFYWDRQRKNGEIGARIKKRLFSPYISKDDVIIDFGCGGGYLLQELEAKEKIGIEVNDYARKNVELLGIKCVKRISEIPDNYADVIISNSALEHTENPYGILKDLHAKLKEGGRAVFYVPNESCEKEYSRSEFNNHLYTWNCLNIGNLFKAAGYFVHMVERVQEVWPRKFIKLEKELSPELFDTLSELGGCASNENKCLIVAYK